MTIQSQTSRATKVNTTVVANAKTTEVAAKRPTAADVLVSGPVFGTSKATGQQGYFYAIATDDGKAKLKHASIPGEVNKRSKAKSLAFANEKMGITDAPVKAETKAPSTKIKNAPKAETKATTRYAVGLSRRNESETLTAAWLLSVTNEDGEKVNAKRFISKYGEEGAFLNVLESYLEAKGEIVFLVDEDELPVDVATIVKTLKVSKKAISFSA